MTTRSLFLVFPELSLTEVLSACEDTEALRSLLEPAGAVLVRDAGVADGATLAALASQLGLVATDQLEPFATRRSLSHGVWSEPAWPATSPMCMHHELGWQRHPPSFLLVACLRPPNSGGRTGLADGRTVLSLLPERLVEHAARDGWTLVRRYSPGLIGMPWHLAFPGMDISAVEAYAAVEEIGLAWTRNCLVTRRRRSAVHATGTARTPAWSNLLSFCSEWTLDRPVREYLVSTLGRQGIPFETSFGDGTPFNVADVETVNETYERATGYVDWRTGDMLLLDNIRIAHSTEPYAGRREMAIMHAEMRSRPQSLS